MRDRWRVQLHFGIRPLGLLLFAGVAAAPGLGSAEARPALPPPEVIQAAHALYFDDISVEDQFRPRPVRHQVQKWIHKGVLRPVKFSHSQTDDWLIDVNKDPSSWICGTGGCPLEIWVKSKTGAYILGFDMRLRASRIRSGDAFRRPYLWVDLHGSHCGLAGSQTCPFAFEWSQSDGFVESGRFTNTTVIRGGALPQAIDPLHNPHSKSIPVGLITLISRLNAQCDTDGGKLDLESVVSRMPDINGDGVREWSADFQLARCNSSPKEDRDAPATALGDTCTVSPCGTLIYLSRKAINGEIGWDETLSSPDFDYGFKILPNGRFLPIRFEPKPGHGPKSNEPCAAYALRNCLIKPFEKVGK